MTRLPPRFWAKVVYDPNGCLLWTGACAGNGYGSWGVDGKVRSTHKSAYEAFHGPVPDGLTVDHACHNADQACPGGVACTHRRCCNPLHLDVCSQVENTRRSPHTSAGRVACHRCGGVFHVMPNGRRVCKACRATYQRLVRKTRRPSGPVPAHMHGRRGGYAYYGCRCSECRAACSAYARDYYARNGRRSKAAAELVAA